MLWGLNWVMVMKEGLYISGIVMCKCKGKEEWEEGIGNVNEVGWCGCMVVNVIVIVCDNCLY